MKALPLSAAALCAALLAACDLETGPEFEPCDAALLQFTALTGDTVTTSTGLRYFDVEKGSGGTATSGADVRVHYTGYLVNGTRFDSSCFNQVTLDFRMGASGLIPGFEQGVLGMREEGVRRVIIPPALGYGSQPNGSIPANSTLIFDIELVAVD